MSALTAADHEEITDTLLAARERIEHLTICGAALQAENDRMRSAVEELAKDAERWKMILLVDSEVLKHPDARKHNGVLKAYMDAIHQGLTIEAAVDSAIAAMKGQS